MEDRWQFLTLGLIWADEWLRTGWVWKSLWIPAIDEKYDMEDYFHKRKLSSRMKSDLKEGIWKYIKSLPKSEKDWLNYYDVYVKDLETFIPRFKIRLKIK